MSAVRGAALLEVRNLRISFGPLAAVRGTDLTIFRGETHCVVGESGCGKSVTALAVMGLLARNGRREADRLAFDGQDLLRLSESQLSKLRGDRMAMIFQEPMTSLNPAYTVGSQTAEVYRRHRGGTRAEALDRAEDLLAKCRVTSPRMRLGQYPHQLSGGLRQRVMIAMALMCDPELLVADEPTTALDVTVQAQILNLLAELRRDLGLTYLFISHNLAVVEHVATEVAVMYLGRIVERRPTEALFAGPEHRYAKALLASVLTPEPGLGIPDVGLGDAMPDPANIPPGCRFHPRCPAAVERCRTDPPQPRTGRDIEVECHVATV